LKPHKGGMGRLHLLGEKLGGASNRVGCGHVSPFGSVFPEEMGAAAQEYKVNFPNY